MSPPSLEEQEDDPVVGAPQVAGDPPVWRRALRIAADVVAILVLWAVLVVPNDLDGLSGSSFLRLPIEAVAIIAIALVVPRRARSVVAVLLGLLLAVLTILKLADMGFLAAFGRVSNPASDWAYAGSAVDLLSVSIGRSAAIASLIVGGILVLALFLVSPWAVLRVMNVVGRHRRASTGTMLLAGVGWVILAVLGLGTAATPFASWVSSHVMAHHVVQVVQSVHEEQTFAEAAAVDPLLRIPDDELLDGLRGKDVIVAFVESYGRVALESPDIAPGVNAVLDEGTRRLSDAGFSSRSSYLTSPTFGGISWLAHATLQSGLWIDTQKRYDELLQTSRETLSAAFKRAGWRTVSAVPSNEQSWSEGERFYRYDAIYDARNLGYRGPTFGYASMPDQYVLDVFRRLELSPSNRANVMAEIDLVSSHSPWTPLPRMVPWEELGDGSVFNSMRGEGLARDVLWRDSRAVRAAFGQSIEYALTAVIEFVEQSADPNLVLVIIGDHQPATIVSGTGASHDVPVTIVAHDPAVLARIDTWGWRPGMRPDPDASVATMDAFRDRFIAAFSTGQLPAAPS